MAKYDYSLIIPVFNQWDLTRNCLKSLAATLKDFSYEILVMDNASADLTPQGCPFLGKQLFGDNFKYLRNESNLNFGPASNLGAKQAQGEFLVFLNNDTVPLPGWLKYLRADFEQIANLAGTGPLLVYPEAAPFGHVIQHLGIYVSPLKKVGHLYEGCPANASLTQKRRFFQAITAACLLMPRQLFWQFNGFDERYVNGFEDVDLCARMSATGLRFTVNHQARVIHFQGQTTGRHDFEHKNSQLYETGIKPLLKPDWHTFVHEDGYLPEVNDWLKIQVRPKKQDIMPIADDREALIASLIKEPFWQAGWRQLANSASKLEERIAVDTSWFRLFFGPNAPIDACNAALAANRRKEALIWFNTMAFYHHPPELYQQQCQENIRICQDNGLPDFAQKYQDWLDNLPNWKQLAYACYLNDFQQIGTNLRQKGYIRKTMA